MSKSILVVDTPDLCIECTLRERSECAATRRKIEDADMWVKKPDWCPLILDTDERIQLMLRFEHDNIEREFFKRILELKLGKIEKALEANNDGDNSKD